MHPLDLLAAVALDAVLGDPEWFPHPVRYVGRLIHGLETVTRRCWRNERIGGTVTMLVTLLIASGAVWGSLAVARMAGPWMERGVAVVWVYFGISARCLSDEARRVDRDLRHNDLPAARRSVARIVGRDTQSLDASGVSRAAIESVAENTVDGILAPLFFAALAGPIGLWVFKAVSTGDSMIGHKDECYRRFGTAAARLDDAANFIPARLAPPLFALAALLTGHRAVSAWRVAWRDRHHHDSPNAGIPEAAMAGALGIRLGGPVAYGGETIEHVPFGAEYPPAEPRQIRCAMVMMWGVTVLGATLAMGAAAAREALLDVIRPRAEVGYSGPRRLDAGGEDAARAEHTRAEVGYSGPRRPDAGGEDSVSACFPDSRDRMIPAAALVQTKLYAKGLFHETR